MGGYPRVPAQIENRRSLTAALAFNKYKLPNGRVILSDA